jgi:hypothetical protein
MSYPGDDGGRVVPAYALTRGRTRSIGRDLPLETLVTATDPAQHRSAGLQSERRLIVEMCTGPMSVVEIAAHLQIPIGVARVLVSDLASSGFLTVHLPQQLGDERPNVEILERLLDGLRAR